MKNWIDEYNENIEKKHNELKNKYNENLLSNKCKKQIYNNLIKFNSEFSKFDKYDIIDIICYKYNFLNEIENNYIYNNNIEAYNEIFRLI